MKVKLGQLQHTYEAYINRFDKRESFNLDKINLLFKFGNL